MRIAVDAFGGDYAPEEIVKGALEAASMYDITIKLVGDEKRLAALIANQKGNDRIEIVHAPDQIGMDEAPVEAVRSKPNSSLVKAARLVREKEAEAMVSAGNTGASMAASLLGMGRIKGVERPAITSLMPTLKGVSLVVDVGANVDCRPKQLYQFALMGSVYAERVLGKSNPKVGLLNIGEEPTKGNETAQEAYEMLSKSQINFIGNIEGRDIPSGDVDVVVCDGFVGNIVLKFAEGLGTALFSMLKTEFLRNIPSKLAALTLKPGLTRIKKKMDYTEYGGAPLLGVKGIAILLTVLQMPKQFTNAIRVAKGDRKSGRIR